MVGVGRRASCYRSIDRVSRWRVALPARWRGQTRQFGIGLDTSSVGHCEPTQRSEKGALLLSNVLMKLAASERPRSVWEATFVGIGDFPFDMLWPASPDDVANMAAYHYSQRHERREVTVHSYRDFTPARWASFGWSEVK